MRHVIGAESKQWLSGKHGVALMASLLGLTCLAQAAHAMQMATGAYTGDGAVARAVTGVGFRPDAVIVKGSTTQQAVLRSRTMAGDASKELVGATALQAKRIVSLETDGFTVGAHAEVNGKGVGYTWIAFRDNGAADFRAASYAGNGADNRSIAGLGFEPGYVIVMSAGAQKAVQRSSAMAGDASVEFDKTGLKPNYIQALEPDGFQVGSDARVNGAGTTYHYLAWKAVAGSMSLGSYPGNGIDNRSIGGAGFRPDYVIVKSTASELGLHRPAALTGDATLSFGAAANVANAVQAFETDGFQVGSAASVNSAKATYFWMAFRAPSVPPPTESLGIVAVNGGARPVAGSPFAVVVQARDAGGGARSVATATGVRLSLRTGTGTLGGNLTGTIPAGASQAVVDGVTYTRAEGGVVLTASRTAGDGLAPGESAAFAVDPGPIAGYGVGLSSPQIAGATFPITVTARDALDNRVTTDGSTPVTLRSASGHVLFDANLDGSFGDATKALAGGLMSVNARGTIAETTTVVATDPNGKTGSTALTISAGAATTLVFTVQPGTAVFSKTIPGPPTVAVQDGFGNTVSSSKASISIALGSNPGGGTLRGTTRRSATGGIASFTDLTISKPGIGYTLRATATGLAAASSEPFTIAIATGTIGGRVTSSGDGTAVPGAAVTALQSGQVKASTSGGADGTYALAALAPGTYDLRVTATGFHSQTRNGVAVTAGSVTTVNVSLVAIGAPSIRITSPVPGSVITAPAVLVRGQVSAAGDSLLGVSVNDVPGLVEGGWFAALVPVDPEVPSLTATLNDVHGALATDAIAVTIPATPGEATMRLQAHPPGGVTPLRVTFSLSSLVAPSQITLHPDAPGVPDFQGTTLDGATVTYTPPGIYAPTARVIDVQGQAHTATTLVHVLDEAALDARLQAIWASFKDAVRAGNLALAGAYLHSDTRSAYQAQLGRLGPASLANIDQAMTTITLIETGFGGAQYEMLRPGPDQQLLSFAVWFRIDHDGVWRLRRF